MLDKDIQLLIYTDNVEWSRFRTKVKTGNPGLLYEMRNKVDMFIVLKKTI